MSSCKIGTSKTIYNDWLREERRWWKETASLYISYCSFWGKKWYSQIHIQIWENFQKIIFSKFRWQGYLGEGFPWKNFKGVWSSLSSSSSSSPVSMVYMFAIACTHGAHFNDFHIPYVSRTYMISLSLEFVRVC